MLFNSLEFGIFLPIVFFFYWRVFRNNLKLQNYLIVIASYIFYGWWDWRFLSLILFSTVVDYSVGLLLGYESNKRKRVLLLWASIIINFGFLGFFKYYNFFLDNFISAFTLFGLHINSNSLNIILPVGISFYTFQTLSYTIDIYNNKLSPTKDFISFAAFVSFFPQLVAGPIERASMLLPQFYTKREFDYLKAINGLRQILWGLFKKIVIADNCAEYANQIFNNSSMYSGSTLIVGALFFTFQIYGDFSGYSDIAIGTARLFGFELMKNFNYPYFSRDIAEFWRRWHISLTTWFRDYLYIPLGGSRVKNSLKIRNTFIVFILSGFWHGANWTFIFWGLLNALYFIPLLLTKQNRRNVDIVAQGRLLPSYKEFISMLFTFSITVFAWIFFRAENIEHAFSYISGIVAPTVIDKPDIAISFQFISTIFFIIILLIAEWINRENQFALDFQNKILIKSSFLRRVIYVAIIFSIFVFGGGQQDFIYFQF